MPPDRARPVRRRRSFSSYEVHAGSPRSGSRQPFKSSRLRHGSAPEWWQSGRTRSWKST